MGIALFAVRRFGRLILTAFIISTVVFLVLRVIPGDPAAVIAGIDASEEDVRAVRYSIFDYSEVESIDASVEELRLIAELNKETSRVNPNVLIAQVGPDPLVLDLSRMWQFYVKDLPWESRLFQSRSEAETWIQDRLGNEPAQEPDGS